MAEKATSPPPDPDSRILVGRLWRSRILHDEVARGVERTNGDDVRASRDDHRNVGVERFIGRIVDAVDRREGPPFVFSATAVDRHVDTRDGTDAVDDARAKLAPGDRERLEDRWCVVDEDAARLE